MVDGKVIPNVVSSHPGAELKLRADGADALRLERTPGSPNVIGGTGINDVWPGAGD